MTSEDALRLAVMCPIGLGDNIAVLNVLDMMRHECRRQGKQARFVVFCREDLSARLHRLCRWIDEVVEDAGHFAVRCASGEFDLFWDFRPAEEHEWVCRLGWSDLGIEWSHAHTAPDSVAAHSLSTRLARQNFSIPVVVSAAAELTVPMAEASWARQWVLPYRRSSRFVVAINRRDILFKSWPRSHYAAVIHSLTEELGATVIAVGTADERITTETDTIVDLCGKLTLEQLVAVLAACDGFLGVDSGPGHLAAALGLQSVIVACPAAVQRPHWRVLPTGNSVAVIYPDFPCRAPCETCADPCIALVQPEVALSELRRSLEGHARSRLIRIPMSNASAEERARG